MAKDLVNHPDYRPIAQDPQAHTNCQQFPLPQGVLLLPASLFHPKLDVDTPVAFPDPSIVLAGVVDSQVDLPNQAHPALTDWALYESVTHLNRCEVCGVV